MSILQTIALISTGFLYGGGDYAWPLTLEPQLTSSFLEYRPGRFHAGIDLRTAGVGREVYAAGDGYVSRVRCSPYGYGKAVYLQLNDGNVAIYAHLSDFYPELGDFVRKEQHRKESYSVDLQLKPSQFPIQKGQLIAYSGQTGIGAPHLHFEMRDAAQQPVNPRLLGFDWPDAAAPRIDRIVVAPRGLDGRVNGDVVPVVLPVTRDEQGRYRTTPVRATGVVGFGADLIDPGSGGYNLGIYKLRLLSNGTEHFRMQHDRMSYTNHRNGAVSYHPYLHDLGRFLLLWRWPGNRCESYQHTAGDGWVTVAPDTPEFVVEATDFYGNSVQVTVPITTAEVTLAAAPGEGRASVDLDLWGPSLLVSAVIPGGLDAPVLRVNGEASMDFVPVGVAGYRALFEPARTGVYTLEVVHSALPSYTREIAAFVQGDPKTRLALGDVEITAGPDSPYGTLFLRAWLESNPPAHGMPARSAAYQVWPGDAPIFDPVTITFPVHDGVGFADNVHVYRHRGAYWSREDTAWENGRVRIETGTPGLFMAMEDTTAPTFASVTPAEGYAAQTRRPEIRAEVSDAGSGIRTFKITCGGKWLLTAYDPERNQIYWEQDEDLPSGPQTLELTLVDEAGNARTYTRKIVVPG